MNNPQGVGGEGRGIKVLTFVSERWEFPRQLGGAPGSIKDHFKNDSGRHFEVCFYCGSIRNRSGGNLAPSWTTFCEIALSKTPPIKQIFC